MTLTATYNSDYGRVQLFADGLPYFEVHLKGFARIQRSRDGVYWKDVRGGVEIPPIPTDDSLPDGEINLNDFEFWENEANTYRLLMPVFLDDFDRSASNGWGTAASGQSYVVGGTASNYFVDSRHGVMQWVSTDTGQRDITIGTDPLDSPDVFLGANFKFSAGPDGDFYSVDFFARYDVGSDDFVIGRLVIWHDDTIELHIDNYESNVVTSSVSADISEMNILNNDGEFRLEFWLEGPVGRIRVYPAGNDPSDWLLATDQLTVTGVGEAGILGFRGFSNTNDDLQLSVSEFIEELSYAVDETSSPITPTVSRCWLKSLDRPFLNREFDIADVSDIRINSRGRLDFVEGETYALYQRQVSSGEQFVLSVYSHSRGERQWINHMVKSGDVIFVQPHNPDGSALVPEHDIVRGHYAITNAVEERTSRRTTRRIHSLSLVRVVEPSADVYGQMSSWQTVLDTYETWQDLIEQSGETWFDLLDLVADPREVVVP